MCLYGKRELPPIQTWSCSSSSLHEPDHCCRDSGQLGPLTERKGTTTCSVSLLAIDFLSYHYGIVSAIVLASIKRPSNIDWPTPNCIGSRPSLPELTASDRSATRVRIGNQVSGEHVDANLLMLRPAAPTEATTPAVQCADTPVKPS